MTKVMVIGLDGATFDIIMPWLDQLPTLKRMMKEGSWGVSETIRPPSTTVGWESLTTGKNPGKTGVFDFYEFDIDGNAVPYFMGKKRNTFMWDIIAEKGKVCVLNVPTIHNPYPINGSMVAGFMNANKRKLTYPEGLQKELNDLVGEYETDITSIYANEKEFLENIYRVTRKKFESAMYLLEKEEWEFFMLVFPEFDRIQHKFWQYLDEKHPNYRESKYKDAIKEYYIYVDSLLKEILSKSKKYTVFIISDHGFGAWNKKFHINHWLESKGLLEKKPNRGKMNKILHNLVWHPKLKPYMPSSAIKYLAKYNKTLGDQRLEWNNGTKASGGRIGANGLIRINQNLPKEERTAIREFIISELKNDIPNIEVFKKEEIYWGEWFDSAPDLHISIDNYKCIPSSLVNSGFFSPSEVGGSHSMEGILIAYGRGIKRDNEIKKCTILDIAPTILSLLGRPIPNDMDGRVLSEVFV